MGYRARPAAPAPRWPDGTINLGAPPGQTGKWEGANVLATDPNHYETRTGQPPRPGRVHIDDVPLQSVEVRRTQAEQDSFLRWACSDYAEVKLSLARPDVLGAAVRGAQLRHELVDAAIRAGGRFSIASTEATREQTDACYPQLRRFLAEKRRFDREERLVNGWYLHQRRLLGGRG